MRGISTGVPPSPLPRHIHDILSAALDSVTGPRKLLAINPAHTANPPTERQIKAAQADFPTLNDH
ncbi:hypothetical protein [Streptomyces sp. NBC_01565]|uniref:hypothetical protein n=1 Tax=unclassified Streptomyces TaxID=2593676 RepID=UPI00225A7001|nr:hypothetical protein [Streptomyces sp. NBC_01565]MCX4540385.1 hypothetical protein [Streptomyces sp. NBC_01565]